MRVAAAFLDFECRVLGSRSEALCPMADVMRFFRYGFPAEDGCVLGLTVGTWPYSKLPLSTPAEIEAAVEAEAAACGYEAVLLRRWNYRMVALLYRIEKRIGGTRPSIDDSMS